MSLFGVHGIVKELLIDMNNKIGSYNLYVVNVRFHLNVFSSQVRISPYIPKRGRDIVGQARVEIIAISGFFSGKGFKG
jgi:hypothetical protein